MRLKQARFPAVKTLDHLEWTALQGVSRPKVLELASCAYLRKGEDVVVVGPVGTGKTHLSIGLGVEATRRRYRVLFSRAATLVRALVKARDERTLGRVQQRLVKVDLLMVDELERSDGGHGYACQRDARYGPHAPRQPHDGHQGTQKRRLRYTR